MAKTKDWREMRDWMVERLEAQTGKPLASWKRRVSAQKPKDEKALRAWLTKEGVKGYSADLLVMERFGYPAFITASADELIDAQYAKRAELRPVFEALVEAAEDRGELVVQARKTYVSLVTPKRTFARVQAKAGFVAVALRLEGAKPGGRLHRSRIHDSMPVELQLASLRDLDAEARGWLRRAYDESA